jgi:hypothetical protein
MLEAMQRAGARRQGGFRGRQQRERVVELLAGRLAEWPGGQPGNRLELSRAPAACRHHAPQGRRVLVRRDHSGLGTVRIVEFHRRGQFAAVEHPDGTPGQPRWRRPTPTKCASCSPAGSTRHAAKSHAHDQTRFRLADTDRDGWVRFAPYPDGKYGGTNALTDILAAIDEAEDEIFFALNKLTRSGVVEALIRACNRGVIVHGVIPKSDRMLPSQDSYPMFQQLIQPTNYLTGNRVRMVEAYYDAARTRYDNNNRDLVHTKYMVIDPRGARPLVIHGSANWTASALVLTSSNDENIQFLPHRGMAEAFTAQFAAMTDGLRPWCALRIAGGVACSATTGCPKRRRMNWCPRTT